MSNSKEHIKALCEILHSKNPIYKLEEIQNLLKANGYTIKRRQLQSYLKDLRNEGAPIPQMGKKGDTPYNFTKRYKSQLANTLSETEQNALELVRSFMNEYKNLKEFKELNDAIDKVLDSTNYEPNIFVFPELKPLKKGFNYFKILYSAIKKGYFVELVYFRNYEDKGISYIIEPLMLKESSGMWYCIAKNDNKEVRAFSIDRITKLNILDKKGNTDYANESNLNDYDYVFGIVKPEGVNQPTTIKIAYEQTLGEMLESKPLHPTQEVIERINDEIIMQYQILYQPNADSRIMRELHRELCKYAGSIRIIEPIELKNEINEILKKGIEKNS